MLVSVIITSYNYARYVERCIRSVLDQSLPSDKYEVIIVDDASTDQTKEILENYKKNASIHYLKSNVGLAASRNFGIKKAKGQFVIFVDADDYIQRDLLKVLQVFLTENNKLDAAAVDYYLVNDFGDHIEWVNSEKKPIACGIMFRKDYLFDIGLYDEAFKAREDEDLRIRFLKHYSIYHLPLPLYRYRMHDANLTKNKKAMNKYKKVLINKHKK